MLRQRLANKETLYGTFVFSSDPAMTEIAAAAGFDFVIVDREHTTLGWQEVTAHARAAAAAGISLLVRVTHADPSDVSHGLDLGAAGVVIPHFGLDIEATKNAARAMRYAPEGDRGTCTGIRANAYGLGTFGETARRGNEHSIFLVQVEDAEVLPRLEELLEDIRVDAILPGVADLSTSLGLAGQFGNPTVIDAVNRLMSTSAKAGVPVGAYVANHGQMATWANGEATFFVFSIDYKVVAEGYRAAREAFQQSL
jgi:2-keto-3-deoxy-L-rhamnonate aldolase RhmA